MSPLRLTFLPHHPQMMTFLRTKATGTPTTAADQGTPPDEQNIPTQDAPGHQSTETSSLPPLEESASDLQDTPLVGDVDHHNDPLLQIHADTTPDTQPAVDPNVTRQPTPRPLTLQERQAVLEHNHAVLAQAAEDGTWQEVQGHRTRQSHPSAHAISEQAARRRHFQVVGFTPTNPQTVHHQPRQTFTQGPPAFTPEGRTIFDRMQSNSPQPDTSSAKRKTSKASTSSASTCGCLTPGSGRHKKKDSSDEEDSPNTNPYAPLQDDHSDTEGGQDFHQADTD